MCSEMISVTLPRNPKGNHELQIDLNTRRTDRIIRRPNGGPVNCNEVIRPSFIVRYCEIVSPSFKSANKDRKNIKIPFMMIIFTITQLIFFLVKELNKNENRYPKLIADTIFCVDKRKDVWRFLTYMLVHTGTMHLISNLILQVLLGMALEVTHHWQRITLIYLFGGATGTLWFSINSKSDGCTGGSSNGVKALISAQLAKILINYRKTGYAWLQLVVAIVYAIIDMIFMKENFDVKNEFCDIFFGHFGGWITGLLLGIFILFNDSSGRRKCCMYLTRWIALLIYCCFVCILVMDNMEGKNRLKICEIQNNITSNYVNNSALNAN